MGKKKKKTERVISLTSSAKTKQTQDLIVYCAAATSTQQNSCSSAVQSDAAGRRVLSHFSVSQVGVCSLRSVEKKNQETLQPLTASCLLFLFFFSYVPEKPNADEGMCVAADPQAWSICIAALLREFAPEKVPFDEMGKLCAECFQHLVIRWLYSLCVIVASPL